jgi:serine/threonine protein kinase
MATKYCPTCRQNFPTTQTACPHDQTVLSLPDPYLLLGRTLLEKYRIDALVGLGGMGAVYCAYHTGLDRRVAFKILQPNIAVVDEHLIELFEREAKVSGRLTHPNIVDVKDAGRTPDGLAYIVMEWLEGRTLDEELRAQGRLSYARTGEILRQIAAALAEAHAKNVVHRDLKPANVMLVQRGGGSEIVKVLDFGIGKILNETGAAVSAVMGTPSYASPEQLQLGGKIDGRSDIYSLGVILYRMLSGRLPFQSNSLSELVQMQLTLTPTALRALEPGVPAALDELVMQMLAKDPELRPADALAVARQYDAVVKQLDAGEAETVNWGTEAATLLQDTPRSPLPQPIWQRTESLPNAPTPRRFEVQAAAATGLPTSETQLPKHRSMLLPGVLLGATLVGGGLLLFRYGFDAGADSVSGRGTHTAQNTATPSATPTPQPSPTVAQAVKPRSTPKAPTPAVAKPDAKQEAPPPPVPTGPPQRTVDRLGRGAEPVPPTGQEQRDRINRQVAQQQVGVARQLYERRLYRQALRVCENALRLDPQNAEAAALQKKIREVLEALKPER